MICLRSQLVAAELESGSPGSHASPSPKHLVFLPTASRWTLPRTPNLPLPAPTPPRSAHCAEPQKVAAEGALGGRKVGEAVSPCRPAGRPRSTVASLSPQPASGWEGRWVPGRVGPG